MASRLHFVPSKKNRQDRRTNEIPIPTSPSYALYYTVSRRILYTCTSTYYIRAFWLETSVRVGAAALKKIRENKKPLRRGPVTKRPLQKT